AKIYPAVAICLNGNHVNGNGSILSKLLPALKAQTVLWTEDFSGGASIRGTLAANYPAQVAGNWTQTNIGVQGPDANEWYVSVEECGAGVDSCGFVCPAGRNDASLHISAIGGLCGTPDCGAAYDAGGFVTNTTTSKRLESPNINTTGFGTISVQFNYIGFGDGINDRAQLVYSCDGGTNWNVLATLTSQCCCLLPGFCGGPDPIPCTNIFSGQGYWRAANFPLPVCAEDIPNLKVGFLWTNNNDGVGSDPSFAVDDITVSYDFVLEARLEDLQAVHSVDAVQLRWRTSGIEGITHFDIQRKEHNTFSSIGQIVPTREEGLDFSFQDNTPYSGATTYRVAAYRESGQVLFSQEVKVQFPSKISRPNFTVISTSNSCKIIFRGLQKDYYTFEVFTFHGKQVFRKEFFTREPSIELNPSQLHYGKSYFFRLTPAHGLPVMKKVSLFPGA
ncbi:MAG: hypothetical protein AAGI38_13775, partial [Bacteroidota bacterium]